MSEIGSSFRKVSFPLKKVEEPVNVAKFDAAKNLLGKNFRVLTEKEIFEQERKLDLKADTQENIKSFG